MASPIVVNGFCGVYGEDDEGTQFLGFDDGTILTLPQGWQVFYRESNKWDQPTWKISDKEDGVKGFIINKGTSKRDVERCISMIHPVA